MQNTGPNMCLLVDVGNSAIKVASFNGKEIKRLKSFSTSDVVSYPFNFLNFLNHFNKIFVCSVVDEVSEIIKKRFNAVFVPNRKVPLSINYDGKMGDDRIMNMIGALDYGDTFTVVSLGTAVVVDFVENREFKGGVIFPGFKLMASSLHTGTSRLPDVSNLSAFRPSSSTSECISSGILNAVVGGIERVLRFFPHGKRILTGGNLHYVRDSLQFDVIDEDLTFKGMRYFVE